MLHSTHHFGFPLLKLGLRTGLRSSHFLQHRVFPQLFHPRYHPEIRKRVYSSHEAESGFLSQGCHMLDNLNQASSLSSKVIEAVSLSNKISQLVLKAPVIAEFCNPGQFLILQVDEKSERIPLTIADFDRKKGTVTVVVQNVGRSSEKICNLRANSVVKDVAGPLGKRTAIGGNQKLTVPKSKTILCVGGGLGVAPVYPIQKQLFSQGWRVVSIVGAKTKDELFWLDKMKECCDELLVATDDGSLGQKGLVTALLDDFLNHGGRADEVLAIGPPVMMEAVAEHTHTTLTHPAVHTTVSLNSIMVDGTGMCGGCRVQLFEGDKTESKFVCVDGPEFDGHKVDWAGMFSRMRAYRVQEEQLNALGKASAPSSPRHPRSSPPPPTVPARPADDESEEMDPRLIRVPMPVQDPLIRVDNFDEVALGYTEEMALAEAERCLQCLRPRCQEGCPVQVDIPGFIREIQRKNYVGAEQVIKKSHSYPAVCGRVCPQETQCEAKCILNNDGAPIAIGRLERFAADYTRTHPTATALPLKPLKAPKRKGKSTKPPPSPQPASADLEQWASACAGRKAAIVGAGPAGLVAAAELNRFGIDCTVFESFGTPGGVLIYGIPEFRLPKDIVKHECLSLQEKGVRFCFNFPVGQAASVPHLIEKEGFSSVFLGLGAGLPHFLDIPGENLNGVYSANEFLTRVNLMKAYRFPEYETPVLNGQEVVVIGGGNVAMDSARCARRLGAKAVYIAYRRPQAAMPARAEERIHAVEEGIHILDLKLPVAIRGTAEGAVRSLVLQPMRVVKEDEGGHDPKAAETNPPRTKIEAAGAEPLVHVPCDQVIVAVGQGPNPLLTRQWPALRVAPNGLIPVDENWMTNVSGVFAGGDIVTGAATVIKAMGAGKNAAWAMLKYMAELDPKAPSPGTLVE